MLIHLLPHASFAASAEKFPCECGEVLLRVRTNSLICDVNLLFFHRKLIKLRRKFNNLRRKLKNSYALAAKVLYTRGKTSILTQHFMSCRAVNFVTQSKPLYRVPIHHPSHRIMRRQPTFPTNNLHLIIFICNFAVENT